MKDKFEEIIQLEDNSDEIIVVFIKPRNKNKVTIYDSGVGFDIFDNKLKFDFWEYRSFEIVLGNIKDVNIKNFDDNMTIAYILLKNGNTIMIHYINN